MNDEVKKAVATALEHKHMYPVVDWGCIDKIVSALESAESELALKATHVDCLQKDYQKLSNVCAALRLQLETMGEALVAKDKQMDGYIEALRTLWSEHDLPTASSDYITSIFRRFNTKMP